MFENVLNNLKNQTGTHAYCLVGNPDDCQTAYGKVNQLLDIPVSEQWQSDELPVPIEKIRELIKWLSQKPITGKTKSVHLVLEGVSPSAANAFLKSLEEPPNYAIIFVSVSNSQNVLPTIKSRCQIVWLGKSLTQVSDKKNVSVFEQFLEIPDALKTKTATQVIDEWIQDLEVKDTKKSALLHKLLKLKQQSLTNTNSRLLVEYGVLLHQCYTE